MSSCWDLEVTPPSSRDALRAAGAGRYSLTLIDTAAGDFEECCRCVACDEESTASISGLASWLVLRRRNGTTLALCPTCADTALPPERNRR